jgi:serine/threonine protein kinase
MVSVKCTGVSYKMEDSWLLSVPKTQKVSSFFSLGVWRSTVVCHMPILFHLLATVLKIHNWSLSMISYISKLCGISFMVQEPGTEILYLLENLQRANLGLSVCFYRKNDIWIASDRWFCSSHSCAGEENVLGWEVRYKVAVGICKALEYLHDGSPRSVIHRDVKPSNILLSHDFILLSHDFRPQVHPTFQIWK